MIFCFALFMDKKIIFERSNMKEFRLNKRLPGPAFPENLSLPATRALSRLPRAFSGPKPDSPKFSSQKAAVHKVKKNALMPWHKDDVPPWFHLNFVLFSLCRGKGRRILRRAVSPCSRRRAACTLPRSLDTLWTGTCLLDPDMSLCLIL